MNTTSTPTSAQAWTPFGQLRRKEWWDHDDELWALQVYSDPCFNNNNIFREGALSQRWGEGVPEWVTEDDAALLAAFREVFPQCGPHAWVDWSNINRVDEENDEVTVNLWVCRSYGTSPTTPPEGRWHFLKWYMLPEEQECPYHYADGHGDTCPFCEGTDYVYHGSGYVLQVWAEVKE